MNHHAFLFKTPTVQRHQIRDYFSSFSGNIQEFFFEKFGVDEARDLLSEFSEKTAGKLIIIHADKCTPEAQNALLKQFEEPTENMIIVLSVLPHVFILETLRSRMLFVPTIANTETKTIVGSLRDFLFSTLSDRLQTIEKVLKEKGEGFTPDQVHYFLDQTEHALYSVFQKTKSPTLSESFQAIRDARGWANQTGFPLKNIVEYIAMIIPVFGKK